MKTFNDLPTEYKQASRLYKSLLEEYGEESFPPILHTRPLHLCIFKTPPLGAVMSEQGDADCASSMRNAVKTDSSYTSLKDLLSMIDTCHFLDMEVPWKAYSIAYWSQDLYHQMNDFEACIDHEYAFFINTPEYKAFRICANFNHAPSHQIINGTIEYYIKNGSVLLLKWLAHQSKKPYIYFEYSHIQTAIENGYIDMIEYFSQSPQFKIRIKTKQKERELCTLAIDRGQTKMLRYLCDTLHFEFAK